MTCICCACMALAGYFLTDIKQSVMTQQNSLYAATIPSWNYAGLMPVDLQLDQAKRIKNDTVYVEIHDTVTVDNIKYVRVPVPEHTTDTIYVPITDLPEAVVMPVKNKSPGDSIEVDEEQKVKQGIILIIDGTTVYSSKPDTINSDGLQEP